MSTVFTYLTGLQNKVFKLLPMREAHDRGDENHLYEYLDNLQSNYKGAFLCYPELSKNIALVEVQNNIAFLNGNRDIDFKKWRSIVLRSTRLLNSIIEEYKEV